jgi:hypothetical protein
MFLLLFLLTLSSHSLFLKLDSFFIRPFAEAELNLLNGTFLTSENTITADRMLDVSIVGPDYELEYDPALWLETNNTAVLPFRAGESGTYLAGVSTKPRNIELTASEFNEYLEHDGVLDVLEKRKMGTGNDQNVVEQYEKHVKAVLQVGNKKTKHFSTQLGYPIEFIPLSNPYRLRVGDKIRIRLLFNGDPLPEQIVFSGYEKEEDDHHATEAMVRTNEEGIAEVKIDHSGKCYLRTIYMRESTKEGLDYESYWATLTFEVR